jgi:hypothetical protein
VLLAGFGLVPALIGAAIGGLLAYILERSIGARHGVAASERIRSR